MCYYDIMYETTHNTPLITKNIIYKKLGIK